jgi:peptidyl-prolyl cis-trans isomerase D
MEYLVLDLEAVRHTLTLNEEDVRTYYKENLERLAGKEERRASHILFNVSKEAPAAEREKAKTQAQELLGQLQKTPSLFAELAKKNSQDSSSAKNGGDLGFFARGAMTPPFENMVFSMKKGQISELVETDFGYHIILLSDIKTPPVPSFEAVRPKLEAELKEKQAQNKFAEVAEIFSNGVYEQADSLQPIAEKLKLKIQKAQHVMRQPIPGTQGALPVLENKKFLESLFSTESIENKRNTEAVEIAKNTLVSGRITEYTSARTLPYEQVQARVREMYVAEKSADLAREQGQAQLKAWKEAPAQATRLRPAVVVSREQCGATPSWKRRCL